MTVRRFLIAAVLLVGCGGGGVAEATQDDPWRRSPPPCGDSFKDGRPTHADTWELGCKDGDQLYWTVSKRCEDGRTVFWNNYAWGVAGSETHVKSDTPFHRAVTDTCG